jgi:hypothetical protein
MTPFMIKLDEVLGGGEPPRIGSRHSELRPLGEALHNQVEIRALAEQLVSEGNTIIDEPALRLTLTDHPGGEHLAFTVSCGRARADMVTDVSGRQGRARLSLDSTATDQLEIDGPEGLVTVLLHVVAQGQPAVSGG